MRPTRQLLLSTLIILPLGVYVACSSDEATVPQGGTSSGGVDAGADRHVPGITDDDDDTKGDDDDDDDDVSPPDGGLERGPKSYAFDKDGTGDPSTLYWDETEQALYVADNKNNDIWKWTDSAPTFAKFLKIPNTSDPQTTDVGQLVRLDDGTFVVPRFGGGAGGGIAFIKDDANKGEVPMLDAGLNRVALAAGGDKIFGGTFRKGGTGSGVVTTVSITDGETTYASGFEKPVSLVLNTGTQQLFVVDQKKNVIYVLAADGGAPTTPPFDELAQIEGPDTTVIGPDNALFTGQFQTTSDGGAPHIRKIAADGTVSMISGAKTLDLVKARGLAYDKKNKRLFIADSDGQTTRTIKIFPID